MDKSGGPLLLRNMEQGDAAAIAEAFAAQGWERSQESLLCYYEDQQSGRRQVIVAKMNGELAGYGTLVYEAFDGPAYGKGIPEIMDLNVFERFRRRGIASAIMNALEELAFKRAGRVSLSVGLYGGHGPAMRMYVKRGYVPEGSGLWQNDKRVHLGDRVTVDDDLVLFFWKER